MAEKTYLTPKAKEPEFVVVPSGSVTENGHKRKRVAIKFYPNARHVGQFTTSDPKIQEYLENHEWFKLGKLTVVAGQHVIPAEEQEPEPTQAAGIRTSEGAVRGGKAKAKK